MAAVRLEVGADVPPREGLRGAGGGGEHDGDPGPRGDARRLDLGDHAAGADPARPAELDAFEVSRPVDLGDPLGARQPGVAVVQGVHVGQQHQRVGVDQMGHQGRQAVVVAEADLVGGHRVVLVHHGDDAELQQPRQGALRVAVVGPAHHVVRGEQHLAHAQAVPGEGGGVAGDQHTLPDRGGGLLGREVTRPGAQAERPETGRDRARGHQHDLRAVPAAGGEDVDQGVHPVDVDGALRRGQRRRPHLHDQA